MLGTIVEIQAGGLDEAEAHVAIDKAFATVAEVQRRMSFHDPESALSRLNRQAAHRAVEVDDWHYEVLSFASEVYRVSNGVFDLSIAPALQTCGFLPFHLPNGSSHRVAGFGQVQLSADRSVRFHDPSVCLDLGGIAKGFAVDQAVSVLKESGVSHGVVNAGGDLRVFGNEAHEVSIRHPDNPGATLWSSEVSNVALATSAHYFADRMCSGATHAPIFHPVTGAPAQAVRSASVMASSAMAADALTKVVMLAASHSLPVLEHFGAEAIFVAGDDRVMCSPGWNAAQRF